ncbi:uncharacterized protein LOC112456278 isoform X2 [Temnothorax curvispinosus]|uniref:Uncharacterized protein LOC112456278 isoform X2 n=1 Tax=Temnothorax curvispinosus TaxID=300111 RepID=A0A6J1PYM0_9HYME|nr:uncharacterized protein LOC112456278 isoform X2 [Temnothorax curvispinosus]
MITYCRTSLPSLTLTLFSAFVFQLLNSLATDLDCMLSELCTTPDSYKRILLVMYERLHLPIFVMLHGTLDIIPSGCALLFTLKTRWTMSP